MTSSLTLIIFLWPRLTLAESQSWPVGELRVQNEVYRPASSDWSGFYDWLRDDSGTLFGLRYSPFPETEFITEVVKGLGYTRVYEGHAIEVFFTKQPRDPVDERSCDQDFLYDQVFRTDSGKYAIAFATDGLTETELRAISQADADWLAV
jgi:hypothetical protein